MTQPFHMFSRRPDAFARGVVLGITTLLLHGCIALPTPGRIERQSNGPNIDIRNLTDIDDPNRPVRPGDTRATVHARLGEPDTTTQHRRDELSTYRSYHWWAFCVIPLGHFWGDMSPTEYVYIVTITYGPDDRVRSITVNRRPG